MGPTVVDEGIPYGHIQHPLKGSNYFFQRKSTAPFATSLELLFGRFDEADDFRIR